MKTSEEGSDKLFKARNALSDAIFSSAYFWQMATDEHGVIQIFNVGAEAMLGYDAFEVVDRITPADISDPQELVKRAAELSAELDTPIAPGFEALVFKAKRGIEDIYELTYVRKDGSRFPAIVSVSALRDPGGEIIGYLLIGTDNTIGKARGALSDAIGKSAYFWQMATDEHGVIQIFNVGAEAMLGYDAVDVVDRITPADISDPQELVKRAAELSAELDTPIAPGFEALVFKAKRGIEDIYELTYVRKDGSRFPAIVSVTALRDIQDDIIGYLLIGTDNTIGKARGALTEAIGKSAYFWQMATDEHGVIQIFNVGAEAMLGYDALEVVDRITPADISDPQELVKRAAELSVELDTPIAPGFEALVFKAKRGIEDIYELTYVRKDGSRFPAIVSVSALRDPGGEIIGYLLIGTDNTIGKARGALTEAIGKSAYFWQMATDEHGVIQIFNVGAEAMLGYDALEVVDRITPADISDPQELVKRAAELSAELDTPIAPGFEALVFKAKRGIEDIYELTYVRKDGSRFPAIVSVSALRDAGGEIIGYLLIGTDNTIGKEVEAAQALLDQQLRDQQFYTRSLIESNVDALMTTDPQGVITDVNQQMMTLTGRTRAELMGAPFSDFFTDPARADAGIARVLAEHKVTDYELTVRAGDGEETYVSYNATTIHDRDGNLQGVFAAARDVTDRRRIERQLLEKNVELEHASRMKSVFLATMSHELRTPLNSVIGFSEALKDGLMGKMTESQLEYIGDIFTSGQHLLSLINDILDLSKVEAGMMELELEDTDVSLLLSNSLSIVREKAVVRGIGLNLELDEDLGVTQLDMRKTRQIVYNLLSNAVKFSNEGGLVSLHARRVPRSAVGTLDGPWPVRNFALADSEYNDFLEISITDAGIGISEENMAKLFQAFTQVDSSLARKFEGTGLGLAMVKQITELLGGSVAVASKPGEGTRIAAWIPLRSAGWSATAELGAVSVEAPPVPGLTERVALVVEDDQGAADLVSTLLEAEGFTVLRASAAGEALQMASRQALHLITLDVQLPGVDGWEFLASIRKDVRLRHVPVVVISSTSHGQLVALDAGEAAVLQKPISRAAVNGALGALGFDDTQDGTRTVLIVDDDPKAVELTAAYLPSPAYATVRANGGREAIVLAKQLQPDLLVVDLMMPAVSGFDVVHALKSDPSTAGIPVLIVTAKDVTALERQSLIAQPSRIVRIMEKAGFNRSDFLAEVHRALLHH